MHNKTRSYMTFDDLAEWEETTTICKIVSGDQEYTLMPGNTVEIKFTSELDFINPELFPVSTREGINKKKALKVLFNAIGLSVTIMWPGGLRIYLF